MPRDDVSVKGSSGGVSTPPHTHNDVVRVINDTLKGRVADIFRGLIPALAGLSGDEFYETVMSNSELLHGCISIFQRNRAAFRTLLVDARGRPVNDDFVALRCGRSVHDITAMIVRTHAKRHFKSTLGGDPNDPKSKAGALYLAINEYLIHDWQVSLVPHYAPLPLAKVQELGPRLLDVREPEILQAMATGRAPAPAEKPKPALPEVPAREQRWWKALNDPAVQKVLGEKSEIERREFVAVLTEVNDLVHADLFQRLRMTDNHAAVALIAAYKLMGRASFQAHFGIPGKPAVINAIADRLEKRGIDSFTDLKAMPQAMEGALRG